MGSTWHPLTFASPPPRRHVAREGRDDVMPLLWCKSYLVTSAWQTSGRHFRTAQAVCFLQSSFVKRMI